MAKRGLTSRYKQAHPISLICSFQELITVLLLMSSVQTLQNWMLAVDDNIRYKKLLLEWKEAKSPPKTPEEATMLVIQTLFSNPRQPRTRATGSDSLSFHLQHVWGWVNSVHHCLWRLLRIRLLEWDTLFINVGFACFGALVSFRWDDSGNVLKPGSGSK